MTSSRTWKRRVANADWTKYDREAINAYAGDVDGRIALISPEFRFNGTVNINYHMHLNEDVQANA